MLGLAVYWNLEVNDMVIYDVNFVGKSMKWKRGIDCDHELKMREWFAWKLGKIEVSDVEENLRKGKISKENIYMT